MCPECPWKSIVIGEAVSLHPPFRHECHMAKCDRLDKAAEEQHKYS